MNIIIKIKKPAKDNALCLMLYDIVMSVWLCDLLYFRWVGMRLQLLQIPFR